MRRQGVIVLLLFLVCLQQLLFVVVVVGQSAPSPSQLRKTIAQVYTVLQKEQVQKSVPFKPFPLQWQETRGLYRSYIHMNFVGDKEIQDILRHQFKIPDSNMFVTTFVATMLLEAHQLGTLNVDFQSLNESLAAIESFHDKNRPAQVPAYVFWPQTEIDGIWTASPVNLDEPIIYFNSTAKIVEVILEALGLDVAAHDLEKIVEQLDLLIRGFRIPADVDDTAVNLALGGVLSSQQFPQLYSSWESSNSNVTQLFELFLKYAYRPFATNTSTNILDPRSYYFLAEYIQNVSTPQNLLLPATWLMNLDENKKTTPIESMPFNTDNVDLSVCANFLFGITHAVVHSLNKGRAALFFQQSQEFRKLFNFAAEILVYAIQNDRIVKRPDVALLYYPSVFDFYWMAARIAFLVRTSSTTDPLLLNVENQLSAVLQKEATAFLSRNATLDGTGAYWDGFLGDYGNRTRGEDRLFSTALAANALLNTWMIQPTQKGCLRQWDQATPITVKLLVGQAVAFLNTWLLSGKYRLSNAFFSGSLKFPSTYPFAYPGTYSYFLNGTYFDPNTHDSLPTGAFNLVFAMQGSLSKQQYQQALKRKWFGYSVPETFISWNDPHQPWPFWSSPSMTYSLAMTAMSNFVALEECV